jgi:hypothetical protein
MFGACIVCLAEKTAPANTTTRNAAGAASFAALGLCAEYGVNEIVACLCARHKAMHAQSMAREMAEKS